MKGVILAAGFASRLRPLTDNCPKCLLQIGGRPLLHRSIEALSANGIKEIIIVTGYRAEMIREYVRTHFPELNIKFIDNPDFTTTNNIYSLWLTRPEVEGHRFILLDSDILFDPRLITRLLESDKDSVLAVNDHPLGDEEIKVIPDSDRLVGEISKTCSIADAVGESVGIELMSAEYSRALFDELRKMIEEEHQTGVFYERAFERLIGRGYRFGIEMTTDLFSMELDTVEDFNQAKTLVPSNLY